MRNLRNIGQTFRGVNFGAPLPWSALTWDASNDGCIGAFGPSEDLEIVEIRRITGDNEPEPYLTLDDRGGDQVIDVHYLVDQSAISVIFSKGDIELINDDASAETSRVGIIGSVDEGIDAAAWSPDEEIVILSTRARTLLFMTREFDLLTTVTLNPEDTKVSNHVSVGWGKAETQFKGKRAKALRDPTVPEKVDQGLLSPDDDGTVTVSWRGDGQYVAVNSIEPGRGRMIRVYSREGILESVSEPVDYLEGALSWRPAGNLIAGIQRFADRIDVVFFERNGLRHGEFPLRLSPAEAKTWGKSIKLAWNPDSTVLAVIFADRVQLWTMGNYHYYLKQELLLGGANPQACWHPEKPLCLALGETYSDPQGMEDDSIRMKVIEFAFAVCEGPTATPKDAGAVAVIDGKTLKLTPLRYANVPPPMALHDVDTDSSILDVSISPDGGGIAALHTNSVTLMTWDMSKRSIVAPVRQETYKLPRSAGHAQQVAMDSQGRAYVLCQSGYGESWIYYCNGPDPKARENMGFKSASGIFCDPADSTLWVSADWGQEGIEVVKKQEQETGWITVKSMVGLPLNIDWQKGTRVEGEYIAFGLGEDGVLYANDRKLSRNCTSFTITESHLIFTTTLHLLKFVHLTTLQDLTVPGDEPEADERCRSIERGARIVTVIPSACSVVLQMPRGNLETIYPRALVVAGIRSSLDRKNYGDAFRSCRVHRVDMNIIHDYAPEQFMSNVALFVDQVKAVEHIDLFLSHLRNEDVSTTMYKDTLAGHPNNADALTNGHTDTRDGKTIDYTESKVNRICKAFLTVLSPRADKHLQNIVSAYVCMSPPDLEGGLRIVSGLQGTDAELADQAAEHISFLADPNRLYDAALGMYELELAVLIAQQSQKDPREYLPFLQRLREMSELRRKFTIDEHLDRHGKALTHLHSMNEFEEAKVYVQRHELYSNALELWKYQQERLDEIVRIQADWLCEKPDFKSAGLAYEYLGDYASASDAFKSAGMWREALSAACLDEQPSTKIASLATDLADALTESKEYQPAARIHLDYLHDLDGALRLLCKGNHFAEAIRLIAQAHRPALLASIIDPGLADAFASTTELLADCKSQLAAQVPRLRDLRQKKSEDPLAFYEGETSADIPDNISLAPTDASTTGTFMTRYTGAVTGTIATGTSRRTSKNRRREERKRARGKKGTVYEEEYLVSSIRRLVERVNATGEEVGKLREGLVRRRMREQARVVGRAMEEVVEGCRGCLGEVFEVEEAVEGGGDMEGEGMSSGDRVLMETLEELGKKKAPPLVTEFEKLAVLG
ncbi:IKI3 family protein [Eremomyces bilateralis CBS 781.70]|uniref:Elongator complex protein 1 n=1 Tax=Eremomyces bilateralis CBS 781.70 TaxID=1392243 RepID=A0A6G1FWZ9_9PEZI|nr:IKI3 family protein [Eremomyces bilateralis CBS 781.70]KAF1810268.1 IKI3 family protein [Eremomyces bilateralis CBS 781.70]